MKRSTRNPARALALLAAASLTVALAACSSGPTPAVPTVSGVPGPGDTLQAFAPGRLHIGSAVAGGGHHTSQDYPDPFTGDAQYRDVLAAEFTSLTPENQLKWEYLRPTQDQFNFDAADSIVVFAQGNGQVVRGHTLLWHSQNPAWLENGDFTQEQLRELLREHIQTVVGRYRGKIHQWDVANEIFDDAGNLRTGENIWIRELGPDIVADAFRWAHEADPDALLFLNDYNVEQIGTKSDAYYQYAQQLLDEGVPLHGFAVQGHLSIAYGAPSMQANLQRFADLGLDVAVTELDVRVPVDAGASPSASALDKQADYYSTMLSVCLAVEACTSFTVWGLPDKYSWVPHFFTGEGGATIMWDDFTRKPAYCALQELLAEASNKTDDAEFAARSCAA